VIGEYVGRIYYEVKRRPHFLLKEAHLPRVALAPDREAWPVLRPAAHPAPANGSRRVRPHGVGRAGCESRAGTSRSAFAGVLAAGVLAAGCLVAGVLDANGDDPVSGVVDGHARFQVLSPTLVRMEYAANGRF